jgi:hypothetical protein
MLLVRVGLIRAKKFENPSFVSQLELWITDQKRRENSMVLSNSIFHITKPMMGANDIDYIFL